jgi:hypothetical protein
MRSWKMFFLEVPTAKRHGECEDEDKFVLWKVKCYEKACYRTAMCSHKSF